MSFENLYPLKEYIKYNDHWKLMSFKWMPFENEYPLKECLLKMNSL